jgi:hypothetical protein
MAVKEVSTPRLECCNGAFSPWTNVQTGKNPPNGLQRAALGQPSKSKSRGGFCSNQSLSCSGVS